MSAPTPAPGDDRPREGYYPDPSIPGYVRYWNGAAWVPGTSRPAPRDGETPAPPPGVRPAQPTASPAAASAAAPVEETGPHFFDEDPAGEPPASGAQHGSRPEPASAWGADRSRQSGFGGDQDRRVSWGAPQGAQSADPRVPGPARPDGTTVNPPAGQDAQGADPGGTFVFRRPGAKPGGAAPSDEGTMTFRAVPPRAGQQGGAGGASAGAEGGAAAPGAGAASGFGASGGAGAGASAGAAAQGGAGTSPAHGGFGAPARDAAATPAAGAGAGTPAVGPASGFGAPEQAAAAGRPGFGAGKAAAARASAGQAAASAGPAAPAAPAAPTALSGPQQAPAAAVPAQPAAPTASATPLTSGPGGGQSSWAQQVHRLAGDEQPVAPWKPPVEDPFQAAARRQAAARPAPLGKRLAARLLDTLVLAGVTSAAAVPLGIKAVDHVNEKIDAARLSGQTVTVWLLDGTTSLYLGIVLAVLLLAGLLYEVLPTAKWGRTLGKKLLGLEVRDIEAHEPPGFGAALRRWLVYSIPGLLVVGAVGVLWGLFDKPWRQCWHDKAAHTFVAG
ncbi:RDD family protein [Streptomyces sp. NPDC052682]|uniref:RDD family protein n=1 Tax=Streptomyces sp. NPDC052682 TaxID=3154954 RepID=UPI0034204072